MGIFKRVFNLFRGFVGLFISSVEKRNPAIAYENAINSLVGKYSALKHAAAAVIARRDTLEGRLGNEREQLRLTNYDLETAVNQNNDDVAVVLLQRKEFLTNEIVELETEFQEAVNDSNEAKTSLNTLKTEISRLKDERDRAIAKLRSAEARIAVQNQIEGLSIDAELKALEGVRESVVNKIAESKLNKELKESSIDNKISVIREIGAKERAVKALEEMKQSRKPAVIDMTFEKV